jgi:hypothetical protein
MRFNDLVYKHFFNDGVMTDKNVIAAWDNLNNYIYGPIICESARWGDERSSNPMDRDHEWDAARLAVRNDLNGRAAYFISRLRSRGYFSTLPAPKYFNASTEITTSEFKSATDISLTINREGSNGVVYYTIDDSDPRTWDLNADISSSAIEVTGTSTTITISNITTVKTRTKNGSVWSPLHEIIVLPNGMEITDIRQVDNVNNAEKFLLSQNYPNPFNPVTVINWQLAVTSHIDLSIYNLLGQKVCTLVSGKQEAGNHKIEWDASGFTSGVYLYRLITDNGFVQTRKLILLK